MRFSSIEIENYRQYKKLSLNFKKGDTDLQIIVGDNGTGKTNLLNAFNWCLYGDEPHLGSDSKAKGEPKLNKAVILDMVDQGNEQATVRVHVELENEGDTIRISRSVPFRVKSISSVTELMHMASFSVVVIGKNGPKTVSSDYAQDYVDRILPTRIREYFFFDGEQLDNYFEDSRSAVLRSAVHSISNIDSVTNMKNRTMAAAKEMAKKAKPRTESNADTYLANIQKREGELKFVQGNIANDKAELEKIKAGISELDGKLRGLPEVEALEQKIAALKERKKEAAIAYSETVETYCLFARQRYIDFAFYEAEKQALKVIETMEKDNQLPPAIDPTLLRKMLKAHKCEVCQRPLTEAEEQNILALLDLFQIGTETSNILTTLRSELRSSMRRVESYQKDKKRVFAQIEYAERNLAQITDELADAENDYAGCPNPEKVKVLREERKSLEAARDKKNSEIGKREGYAGQIQSVIDSNRKKYKEAVKKQGLVDEFSIAADFGLRAADVLALVEKEVIDETRESIERQAEDLFKGLVWKGSKCDHIGLTEDYQLSLYDRYGFSCAGTCSAAERNLLALSFTLAMHKVSGFESPMIIDTPIARASGDNRANFAATLAAVSKRKQLILTFTPDEYSEAIASVLDPIAASNLRLAMDGAEMVVSVKGGE